MKTLRGIFKGLSGLLAVGLLMVLFTTALDVASSIIGHGWVTVIIGSFFVILACVIGIAVEHDEAKPEEEQEQ